MITDRRTILTGAAASLVAVPAMAMAQRQRRMGMDPAAMPMPDVSGTRTHAQFEMGVFGPAMLSLATSQIAVDRARRADAREFAGFELTEAVAVTTVLKQLGNTPPPMTPRRRRRWTRSVRRHRVRRSTARILMPSTRTTCSCAIWPPPIWLTRRTRAT